MSGSRRTPIERTPLPALDAETVRLFKRGTTLIAEGRDETLEFKKISTLLHRRLSLRPWMPTVFDVDDEPPDDPRQLPAWNYVADLREQLAELARPRLVSAREAEADDVEQAELPR